MIIILSAKASAKMLGALAFYLFGLGLIKAMPKVFDTLSVVGTAAMLWVGGHLLWKTFGDIGLTFFKDTLYGLTAWLHRFPGIVAWFGDTLASAIFGLAVGVLFVPLVLGLGKLLGKLKKADVSVQH